MATVSVAATVLRHDGARAGTAANEVLVGTSGPDVLEGHGGDDRLLGKAGDDRLEGGPGNDTIVGGPGRDKLVGGAGDDRFYARDGAVDRIVCGSGNDRIVTADPDDVRVGCELDSRVEPLHGTIERVDQSWTCKGPVNLDLVKVTMLTNPDDAIHLRENCTGRIGRIEVETRTQDGVKVNAVEPAAHDLVIQGGYIRCDGRDPRAHQDGIQVMGGSRITFRDLEINCNSRSNAQFFVSSTHDGNPTDVVCEGCLLGSGSASTLFIATSTRSGAKDSVICRGRYFNVRIGDGAVDVVNEKNRVLSATDARCAPTN